MMPDAPEHEIYVGYRPTPRRHRMLLRFVVPALLWAMCAVSALVALSMARAGDGTWDATKVTLEGRLAMTPYAVLDVPGDETVRTYLLLDAGKLGARPGLDALDGQRIRATGTLIERQGRRVLELLPGEDGVRRMPDAPPQLPAFDDATTAFAAWGEIVDYKCFLGAMKPGDGATHRACATLCVRGGVPPAFITRTASGDEQHYILVDPNGEPFNDHALPWIAKPVWIEGAVIRRYDQHYLRVDPANITPQSRP